MQTTKLGISVALAGVITCLVGLFGGFLACVIVLGYVLLVENNPWLRKTAVKVFLTVGIFALARTLVGLLPDAIGLIDDLLGIFNAYFSIAFLSNLVKFICSVLTFAEKILLIILGIKAFNQGTLCIPVIDGIIDKYMNGYTG